MRGQARANGPCGIFDIVGQLHFAAAFQRVTRIFYHQRIKCVSHFHTAFSTAIARCAFAISLNQDGVQIQIIKRCITAGNLFQQISPADHLFQAGKAERGQNFAHLFCNMCEQLDHFFRRAFKLCPQIITLCADPDRAGIGMTLTHHDTAHRHQSRSANTKFICTQHGGHHNIAARFQAAICAQHNLVTQAIHGQDLMHF